MRSQGRRDVCCEDANEGLSKGRLANKIFVRVECLLELSLSVTLTCIALAQEYIVSVDTLHSGTLNVKFRFRR